MNPVSSTLGALMAHNSEQFSREPAILSDPNQSITHLQLFGQIEETVAVLNSLGVGRNDRVAIVLPQGPELAVTFLSVACAATAAPLNHGYNEADFNFYLEDLKAKGVIRAHGVSVHSLDAMKTAVADPWVDVLHARINPYGIAMDKPDPAEVVEVIHQMHASGRGVIGMKLVGDGKLRDDSEKIDHSLRFVLGLGSVDMMIVGFETEEQIDNYMDRTSNALKALA